jgi:hypothetical protein
VRGGKVSVVSYAIEYRGQYVGHALTLGERFQLHTTRDGVRDLNEQCFLSLAELKRVVFERLSGKGMRKKAA